jgi:copper chaperone NosL
MTRLGMIGAILLLAVVGAACGTADASGPPEIKYGRDICVECGMIIGEARFATGYRLADGTEKAFDDVGGMVLHLRSSGDTVDDESMWVHDFETEVWVTASRAYFVPTISVASPMGHSIIAFADSERAASFADDVGADVIDWATVLSLPASDGLVGHHHGDSTDDLDSDQADMSGEDMDHDSGEHDQDSDG